jgi:acyl carrier protein
MGIDAVDGLESVAVMRLEKEFSIRLPDDECEKCSTLGDLMRFVAQKVQQK